LVAAQVVTCAGGYMRRWLHAQVAKCAGGHMRRWLHAQVFTFAGFPLAVHAPVSAAAEAADLC